MFRWRRVRRLCRIGIAAALGVLALPIAWLVRNRPVDPLATAVGKMLMIGFAGTTRRSWSARLLAAQLRAGSAGGVFFVSRNIGSEADVVGLLQLFRRDGSNPLIAIDHEGGVVQRLTSAHHMTPVPSAHHVAATMTPDQAKQLYAQAGHELHALGFNINLGPVVDFHDPANPAIGRFGRSYGSDPEQIVAYATAFVDGFSAAGVLCAIKHFPGHGHSRGDSHDGPADISTTWSEAELVPFMRLIATDRAPMVMGGHLRLDGTEATTLSPQVTTTLLRGRLGFTGVSITDDLDMDAVSCLMSRRNAVIQAIAAGNDLLMIKNLYGFDPLLPRRVLGWVRASIASGALAEQQIMDAANRIRVMRQSHSA